MPDGLRKGRSFLRFTPLLGVGLLAYLMTTVKWRELAGNAKAIGWGMLLVIALAGISHVVKTCAWRLTLRTEARKVTFARTLGLRLISEAISQFGFIGMVGGDATRLSLLGSRVTVAGAISSVVLDRSIFILSGAAVTIAGIVSLLLAVSVPHLLRLYAGVLVIALLCLLLASVIAVLRKWPVFSAPARAAARFPWFRAWLQSKESTLETAERQIVQFHQEARLAFWFSVLLYFVSHFLAIAEVYLILKILGAPATLLAALILESLTKLINAAGAINPGNVGTYEGGNMVIGRLVRLTGSQGLLLALCRRARAAFWGIVGGICLVWFSKRSKTDEAKVGAQLEKRTTALPLRNSNQEFSQCETVFILAHDFPNPEQFEPALAKVATVPILLRTILGVQRKQYVRTIVVVNCDSGPKIQSELLATGRLPADAEWVEVPAGATLSSIVRAAAVKKGRVEFVRGNCSYRPKLFQMLDEGNSDAGAMELVSSGRPVGLVVLGHEVAEQLGAKWNSCIVDERDLHHWLTEHVGLDVPGPYSCKEVDEDSWQTIARREDCISAERKLNQWLVKPTDGIFARMNRRVSIPISRRLIKFPITPNMISLFTLALSLLAGGFFALGGYWNCVFGALLGVAGSILDGCDGEVARLKLQVSAFGCWLDTVCDYLYYCVTFAGIIIGVLRSTGDPRIIGWGVAIFSGALLTFITSGIGRKRLSGKRPEQYLQVWQKAAESHSSNVLLRLGRQTEFIVRRCFLPYFLLAIAALNLMHALVYMVAFGANVAWIVSLRALVAFSGKSKCAHGAAGSSESETEPVTA
jgi:phosphatidylglycerophosphate synthase